MNSKKIAKEEFKRIPNLTFDSKWLVKYKGKFGHVDYTFVNARDRDDALREADWDIMGEILEVEKIDD